MTSKTSTIYARVPVLLKSDVDKWAKERNMTLAGAISLLLTVGLEYATQVCPTCNRLLPTEKDPK